MKNKYIRGLALGMAAMTAFTFTTPQASLLSVEAATATKATKGTSKITASAKTVKVAKGKTATVKLTLNKKQTKDLKITVKSKNAKIAKVTNASKVIVKKGKKVASVKVKGVKANSSTKVTASFKTSAGKTKSVTFTVKVNPIALTKVALNNKTPKVGDKLTATITPSNASAVTYKWYMGDSASKVTTVISGQTKKTLTVTDAMEGKFIKVTATGKTAAGKAVSKSVTTTAAVVGNTTPEPTTGDIVEDKVAVTGVTLSSTAPKVGDTVTATVAPENATNVKYAWYLGNSSNGLTDLIAGETTKEIKITKDMVGKYLGVVVSGEENSSANAATAVAIQEADSAVLELTAVKQTGAKTIDLTINGTVTANDKITVKKGSDEIKIDNTSYTDAGATLTLADKITASEYEVTLTPGDTKVAATSVKFTGEISELKEIKFLNNYLVLKDNKYQDGFAYAKGYDQFGGEVTLSGLSVTAGVGEMKSYDSATGKIELHSDTENAYMLIKEVPVFIQYQAGNNMITANQTLTVSTRSYVNDVEFGEIKKDGKMRDDKRVTMTELRSKKYYIELNKVQDQYGNDLNADDLNTQKDDNVLFVIPGNTGAFYTTGKFGTLNNKTILWLEGNADSKPGTMALTLTGAGGKTFTKDITIEDDPYIQTLTVSYPELYAGNDESTALEFTAVDQYGNDIDMWDVKPNDTNANAAKLEFTDFNNMTRTRTTITVGGNATFNKITSDTSKKSFKVTLNTVGASAKDMITFTLTTAGMQVSPKSITVGEIGTAAKVKDTLSDGNRQLVASAKGKDSSFNFNKYVQFEDANGNTMSRDDSRYPVFYSGITVDPADSKVKASTYDKFAWTLTSAKVSDSATAAVVGDANGVINYTDIAAAGKGDFYVTVYAHSGLTAAATNKWYKLDDQDFHLTAVTGADKTFEASTEGLLYAAKGSTDANEIKVMATTENSETYEINPNRISLVVGGEFTATGNKVNGALAKNLKDDTTGKVPVTVYVDGKERATVSVDYSNVKPVATKAELKFDITTAGNDNASKVGAKFDGDVVKDDFENAAASKYELKNGVMTITGANTMGDQFTAQIKDQYDVPMTDTEFYVDGKKFTSATVLAKGTRYTFQYKSGDVSKKFYMTIGSVNDATVSVPASTTTEFSSWATLKAAMTTAAGNGIADTFTYTGNEGADNALLVIGAEDTLEIAAGATLNVGGPNAADMNTPAGTIINNGTVSQGAYSLTVAAGKTWTNNGTWKSSTGNLTVDGTFVNNNSVSATGAATIGGLGHYTNNANATTDLSLGTINMEAANTYQNFGKTVADNIIGYAKLENGSRTEMKRPNPSVNLTLIIPEGAKATLIENGVETKLANSSDTENFTIKEDNTGNLNALEGKGTVQEGNAEPVEKSTTSYDVENADQLLKALDNAAKDGQPNTIKLTKNIELASATATSFTIPASDTLVIGSEYTLTVNSGDTIINNGNINNAGSIVNNKTIKNDSKIDNNGSITGSGEIANGPSGKITGKGKVKTTKYTIKSGKVAPNSTSDKGEKINASVKDAGITGFNYTNTVQYNIGVLWTAITGAQNVRLYKTIEYLDAAGRTLAVDKADYNPVSADPKVGFATWGANIFSDSKQLPVELKEAVSEVSADVAAVRVTISTTEPSYGAACTKKDGTWAVTDPTSLKKSVTSYGTVIDQEIIER